MVYQNPGSALNPSLRIGTQVAEAFTVLGVPAKEAMERAREALVKVQIADPASVLGRYPHQLSGRHAAARRDRDGARERARAPDPRRADDGPRRDRRGRGPRSRLEPAVRVPHRRPLHQPQPRRDLEDVRPRRRPLRRPARRGRAGRHGAPGSTSSVHRRPPALHSARRRPQGQGPARHDPRLPAEPRRRDPGLRLRRPLRARRRPLPHRGAGADRADAGPPRALLPPGPGAGPPARGGREPRAAGDRPHGRSRCCSVDDLGKVFKQRGQDVHALVGVSAAIWPGETLGLVGESGQRQDHPRPNAARDRAADDRIGDARGVGARADVPEAFARRSPLDPDRLPEPRFGAQPASLRAAHPAAVDEEARRRHRRRPRMRVFASWPGGSGSPSAR